MTLEEYKRELKKHDWHYEMSDDPRVFRNGESKRMVLRMLARNKGPDFKNAYIEEYQRHFGANKFPRI